jgi:hypothetical protein
MQIAAWAKETLYFALSALLIILLPQPENLGF